MDDATARRTRGFVAAWETASRVEGWLTRAQAAELYETVASLGAGATVVEIGSHRGRSTLVLAAALPPGSRLVAVDPFPADWKYGAADTEAGLRAHLSAAGVADRVEILVTTSRAARASYDGSVQAVYIDGKHDYWTVRDDLRWAELVPVGGVVLVHDAFSSLGVTLALLRTLPFSRRVSYVRRTGSLARLEVRRAGRLDWIRMLAELPWLGRNLLVKVVLRLRLRPLARLLGHAERADPY